MSHLTYEQAPPERPKIKRSAWFRSLVPTCKEVTRLTSEGLDHPLPTGMRLRLRLHRCFCQWCARYAKQLDLVQEASVQFPEHLDQMEEPTLDAHAKARMKFALRDAIEKRIIAISGLILSLMI